MVWESGICVLLIVLGRMRGPDCHVLWEGQVHAAGSNPGVPLGLSDVCIRGAKTAR